MSNILDFLKKRQWLGSIILLALFVFGGVIGGFLVLKYGAGGNYNFSGQRYTDQGLVIANAKNVTVTQDVKVDETLAAVAGSLVGIYKKQKPLKADGAFAPDNFYKLNAAAGQGFVITADGWIATALPLEKNYADYVVIGKDKKIQPIDRAVGDKLTGFSFIHVNAKDLPVRKLAGERENKTGSLALAVNRAGLSQVSTLAGFNDRSGQVKNSDDFYSKILLDEKLAGDFRGAAVFNLAGDALGLADLNGEIMPVSALTGAIKSLFKNQTAARASLGVNYYDLTELMAADGSVLWQKGAALYRSPNAAAITKGSPAETAGLKEGDVILSVNNITLDKDNDLAGLIQQSQPGDKINLTYSRAGTEKNITVTLAEKK